GRDGYSRRANRSGTLWLSNGYLAAWRGPADGQGRRQRKRRLLYNRAFAGASDSGQRRYSCPSQRAGIAMRPMDQHEIPFEGRRLRNPKLRRGIFLLPSLFTVANLLCGYYAVVACLFGGSDDFDRAAKAIGFAILFDSLDGRVARLTGTGTEFGVQFDSLA